MSNETKTLPPFLLNASQVAKRLGTSAAYAYKIMKCGEIPVVRLGRSVRVRPQDLEAFIEASMDLGEHGKTAW